MLILLWGLLPASALSASLLVREIAVEGMVHTQESRIREEIQVELGQDLARWEVQQVLRESGSV